MLTASGVVRRAVDLMRFARDSIGASAASLFLVDEAARTARGLVAEWDWTRTSFPAPLADWPSVDLALRQGAIHHISAANAAGAETGWFEPRGIGSTVCVPLRAAGRPLGVLFFDFDGDERTLGAGGVALLAQVAALSARVLSDAVPLERVGRGTACQP